MKNQEIDTHYESASGDWFRIKESNGEPVVIDAHVELPCVLRVAQIKRSGRYSVEALTESGMGKASFAVDYPMLRDLYKNIRDLIGDDE